MRSVDEWIGKNDDTAIPPRVRLRVFDRANGKCEKCNTRIHGGRWSADHITAIVNGGANRETNLQCLCDSCHSVKTVSDVREKSKVYRIRAKHLGIKKPSRAWGYGKNDKYKMKIGGRLVLRNGG